VGDRPHRIHNIFEFLEGNYPRLRVYLNSPAAQSIAAAEEAFPILKRSGEFDRDPLMDPVQIATNFTTQNSPQAAKWYLLSLSTLMLGTSLYVFRRGFFE
jgi:hypothetical protein